MTMTYHERREIVARVINQADPMGLLAQEAPGDEYSPEIDDIALRMAECKTVDDLAVMIRAVFVHYFDEQTAGPVGIYEEIAIELSNNTSNSGTR